MMRKVHIIYLFSITGLLNSCFSSEEENFSFVTKPRESLSVVTNVEGDTVYIYDKTTIEYSISTQKESIASVEVRIDGDYVSNYSTSNKINFEIDPLQYGTGTYELEIEILLKSGTGSLADEAGVEFINISNKKILVIDIDPPTNEIKTQFEIDNGRSIISWNKPNKDNLLEFILLIKPRRIENWDSVKIKNPNQISYHDINYAGGEIEYQLIWRGYNYTILSNIISANVNTISELQFQVNDSDEVNITAPNLTLYGNIFKMNINHTDGPFSQYLSSIDRNISLVDNTPMYFGGVREYEFWVGDGIHFYYTTTQTFLGNRIKNYDDLIYVAESDFLVTRDYINIVNNNNGGKWYKFYKYNFSSMELLDSLIIDVSSAYWDHENEDYSILNSENGQNIYVFYKGDIYTLNLNSMELIYYNKIEDLLSLEHCNGCNTLPWGASISNNNIAVMRDNSKWKIYNFSTGEQLNEYDIEYANNSWVQISYHPVISPDGNYVYNTKPDPLTGEITGAIYSFNGTDYHFKGHTKQPLYAEKVEFIERNGTTALIGSEYDGHVYYLYDLEAGTDANGYLLQLERSPYIGGTYNTSFKFYDRLSNSIFGHSIETDMYQVYDLDTWDIKKELHTIHGPYLQYLNGRIFSSNGLYLE